MLGQTSGKDKMAKILQYGAKLLGHMMAQKKMAEWAGIMKKLETSAGGARKVWRLGNTFAEQQKIIQLVKAGNVFQILSILAIIRQSGMYFYWVFDNLVWSTSIGLTKFDTTKLSRFSSVAWFIGLCCSIIIDLHNLKSVLHKEKTLIAAAKQVGQTSDEMVAVQKKKDELYLNCVKNSCDAVIAANLLKFYTSSQGTVGICGLISACIGGYQMWPSAGK
eukprot:gene19070-22835_t